MIIAIDGPAGSGKSTTAKAVAQILGFKFLDTGAMYRTVTLMIIREGIDIRDSKLVEDCLERANIDLQITPTNLQVFLNGEDVTGPIRSADVNGTVSQVSELPEVRKFLVALQREFAKGRDIVAEGRDVGTVVFPDANLKIFMIAAENERAKRRLKELIAKGIESELIDVRASIMSRDQIDSNRTHSPLLKADDAYVIDTTQLNFKDQVEMVVSLFRKKMAERKLV